MSNRDVDAVEALFNPRRMAVIGASSHLAKWGRIVPSNIMRDGYKGELYLVNPRGGELNGMTFYPSAAAIGKEIDLAMVTIPAENVEGVLEDCAAAVERLDFTDRDFELVAPRITVVPSYGSGAPLAP